MHEIEQSRHRLVRRGSVIHRPPGPGSAVMVALLEHLASVGYQGAPRYLGLDPEGWHKITFIEGECWMNPAWQTDDWANATMLGRVATMLADLHEATAGFNPPEGSEPQRPLPIRVSRSPHEADRSAWTHGDVGYANIVFRANDPIAFIDWEFAAEAAPICDPAALLAVSTRGPRPDVEDNERRAEAVTLAADAIADGYHRVRFARHELYESAAIVLDDAADYWEQHGLAPAENVATARWRAEWFRTNLVKL